MIVKTEGSNRASPIEVVPKADKTVRICGDYKVPINSAVEDEQSGADTGGVDRVDIHPPFFIKKNSKCHLI